MLHQAFAVALHCPDLVCSGLGEKLIPAGVSDSASTSASIHSVSPPSGWAVEDASSWSRAVLLDLCGRASGLS